MAAAEAAVVVEARELEVVVWVSEASALASPKEAPAQARDSERCLELGLRVAGLPAPEYRWAAWLRAAALQPEAVGVAAAGGRQAPS